MKAKKLTGRSIAAVLMTEDDGYYVVYGTVVAEGKKAIIDCGDGRLLPLRPKKLRDVRRVKGKVRGLLGDVDLWVAFTVGNLSDEEAQADDLIQTGINLEAIEAGG